MKKARLLIAGLGNELLMDDGIGVLAARQLAAAPPAETTVVEIGTDFLSAVSYMESHEIVLAIDAMDAQGPPGTLYEGTLDEIDPIQGNVSLHELGLKAMLNFIEPPKRPRIYVLGIQPGQIAYGMELSSLLQEKLPFVVSAARVIADRLLQRI